MFCSFFTLNLDSREKDLLGRMGESSRKMDIEELMKYSNNLIDFLKDEKDIVGLQHFLRHSKALQSQCDKDLNEVQLSIEDYKKKIEACKQEEAAAESESVADVELDLLEKELEERQKVERMLREELRVTVNGIDDLELQRANLEEQRQTLKKSEQDELRAEMKLSMHASVTNIIPNLDDLSKISGYIVVRDKKVVDNFEFDRAKHSAFDACNGIWKMMKLQ
ncbi:kinetochore protein SPC24 homolog isoform X1 [Primulina eburnea]|uniref:kinetochore protein SPC24 homolog isoform X1 n=1 Tax=Primulina eburnea TaxID=1245227 RepID=UPI003C6C3DB9